MNYFYSCPKPLGYLIVTLDEKQKVSDSYFSYTKGTVKPLPAGEAKTALDNYFTSQKPLALSLVSKDIKGTDFQKSIWSIISKTKFGKTVTYTELAEAVGNTNAVRAAGTACGQNKIALFIPCHRVVRKSGEDMGYAWGPERKRALLVHEGVI